MAAYHTKLKEAEVNHAIREQIDSLSADYRFETDMLDDEIALTITKFWVSKAEGLFLPIPERDDNALWAETTQIPDRRVLTPKGVTMVRSQVRAERKAQMETWLPLLAAVTGLIGTLIGFVAILKKGGP